MTISSGPAVGATVGATEAGKVGAEGADFGDARLFRM